MITAASPVIYGGVISLGITYTLQDIAQKDAKPARAAIFLRLESVFAVFWGMVGLKGSTYPEVIGGEYLMLAGMIKSQIRNPTSRFT